MNKPKDFKARLLELRKRLIQDVNASEEALREEIAPTGDLSALPTHPGDRATGGIDEQIAIAANEEALLEQVEAALQRIEDGTYGLCENCHRRIDAARLEALPAAAFCIDCATQREKDSVQ